MATQDDRSLRSYIPNVLLYIFFRMDVMMLMDAFDVLMRSCCCFQEVMRRWNMVFMSYLGIQPS